LAYHVPFWRVAGPIGRIALPRTILASFPSHRIVQAIRSPLPQGAAVSRARLVAALEEGGGGNGRSVRLPLLGVLPNSSAASSPSRVRADLARARAEGKRLGRLSPLLPSWKKRSERLWISPAGQRACERLLRSLASIPGPRSEDQHQPPFRRHKRGRVTKRRTAKERADRRGRR
jgi:hypothetical protein